MFSKLRIIAMFGAAAAVCGCSASQIAHKTIGSPDPGFGEVTRHNAAVHIIDPDPVYTADASQPGDDGAKAASATKRYRTDAVKTPVEQSSQTSSGGGSR